MQTQTMTRLDAPLPFCCPRCRELMQFKAAEPWTLLRGKQLSRLIFECDECGHVNTRVIS